MIPKIKFSNLARQLLPVHKRRPDRLLLLRGFLSPLQTLFDNFNSWCGNMRMIVNVNSQVKVLEGYLRKKYNEPVAIRIATYQDTAPRVGLRSEGTTHRLRVGIRSEGNMAAVPLRGEIRSQFDDVDFIVYISARVDIESLYADIERFKKATVSYKIIQS